MKLTVALNIARKVSSRCATRKSLYVRVDGGTQDPMDQSLARNVEMDKMEYNLFSAFKALSITKSLSKPYKC